MHIFTPTTHALLVGVETCAFNMEISVWFLKKLKIDLPYDPAISFLSIFPKGSVSYYSDSCLYSLIAAMFTIAEKGNI